eukprot:4615680-Amphidinium_carterae.1
MRLSVQAVRTKQVGLQVASRSSDIQVPQYALPMVCYREAASAALQVNGLDYSAVMEREAHLDHQQQLDVVDAQ